MDLTIALTGMLPAILVISTLLTFAASIFLLWLYRRQTLRGMEQVAGTVPPPSPSSTKAMATALPLRIEIHQSNAPLTPSPAAEVAYRRMAQALRNTVFAYGLGGLVYALVLTAPWMIIASKGLSLTRFPWFFICYCWPTVLAIGMAVTRNRREFLTLAAKYLAMVAVIGLLVLVRSPSLSLGLLIFSWVLANAPSTILLLTFLNHRVRAVGPLVLGFMVAGVTGAFLVFAIAGTNEDLLRVIVNIGQSFGLGTVQLLMLILFLGFAAFSVLGILLLGWIGRLYQAKQLSDRSLSIDSLFLLFAVVQSINLVFEGWGWIFTGVLAFASYKLTVGFYFARLSKQTTAKTAAPMLLLLRVFALGHRSEQMFDTFSKWWRHWGSISLITGPDLVTTTVEPHQFLNFLSGQLSRQFVRDEADLQQRLATLDRQPDPDRYFRVNDFFCRADTWQMTMARLAEQSDAVLMDLRSFSRNNQGCLYELEQILNSITLERVAFVVDRTTDLLFLEEKIQELWQDVAADSPNRQLESPTVHLFPIREQSEKTIKAILLMLLKTSASYNLSR